jgi:hypothetical protein
VYHSQGIYLFPYNHFLHGASPLEKSRDYANEKKAAMEQSEKWYGQLVLDRDTGVLDSQAIKLAQVMLLCALPYQTTPEREVSRTARLGDGSMLEITFGAGKRGVPLPFGSDRKLLSWLLDKAIRSDSPFVEWSSAEEYMREFGLTGGSGRAHVRASFKRISYLIVRYERLSEYESEGCNYSLIERWRLPNSIAPLGKKVVSISSIRNYGVVFNQNFYADIKKHQISLPRGIWSHSRGSSKVHDIMLWLYVRCYQARSESMIPFATFEDQFGVDSNPRRLMAHIKKAITILCGLWPGAQIEVRGDLIWVDRATAPMLPDDPAKKRRSTL